MRVYRSLDSIDAHDFEHGSAVAVGKFDGVHLGHQRIMRNLIDRAAGDGAQSVALTFANNPLSYLNPAKCPPALMSCEQRLETLTAVGIDACVMLEFDAALAAVPAEQFVRDVLVDRLRATHVVVGDDFRFGHGGRGDAELLTRMGADHGFTVERVDAVADADGNPISSSRIREVLEVGDVALAAALLGRPPRVRGEVVHGDARGRELGFPTANLGGTAAGGPVEGYVPADGVYAGWAQIGDTWHRSAISVGNNPTFTPDEQSRVEAFLLDFDRDVYGERIDIAFVARLRGTERFDSLEALIEQMHADVDEARALLTQPLGA